MVKCTVCGKSVKEGFIINEAAICKDCARKIHEALEKEVVIKYLPYDPWPNPSRYELPITYYCDNVSDGSLMKLTLTAD